MTLAQLIDDFNEWKSPYRGDFVNHVPMAQYALYQMTGSLEKVQEFTEYAKRELNADAREKNPKALQTLYDVLGKPDGYSSAYEYLKKVDASELEPILKEVLNQYPEAMSSGLFHVMIRLAYALEGESEDELRRALAYYVSAYKKAVPFTRTVPPKKLPESLAELSLHPETKRILSDYDGIGNRLKAMANSETYMKEGFILEGSAAEQEQALLSLLSSSYQQSGSIIALHGITGLHAFKVLEPYYDDPAKAFDLFVTACINHLLMMDYSTDFTAEPELSEEPSWDEILKTSSLSRDVHTLKLAYSAFELEETYGFEKGGLKADQKRRLSG